MTTIPAHDGANLQEMIGRLAGFEIAAMALVCVMGVGANAAVAAFITLGGARSAPFCHAIELEGAYCDGLLGFDAPSPPYYGGAPLRIDLAQTAAALAIERILCLVTLDSGGNINVARDYDGLEVTLLEAARTQFDRFGEILAGNGGQEGRAFRDRAS